LISKDLYQLEGKIETWKENDSSSKNLREDILNEDYNNIVSARKEGMTG
jgi:hypothetical protein